MVSGASAPRPEFQAQSNPGTHVLTAQRRWACNLIQDTEQCEQPAPRASMLPSNPAAQA